MRRDLGVRRRLEDCQASPPSLMPEGPLLSTRAERVLMDAALKWRPQWSETFRAGHGREDGHVDMRLMTLRMGPHRSTAPTGNLPPFPLHTESSSGE